jgi:hypothetical protein
LVTLPALGLGTVTVALSVSISIKPWSFETTSPSETKISKTSPDLIPSPSEGSLTSNDMLISIAKNVNEVPEQHATQTSLI